eukprot:scaffold1879_cov243-Chaetoceros_neogracile.AAC.6
MKWSQAVIILLASSRVEALAFTPTTTTRVSHIESLYRHSPLKGTQLYAASADEEEEKPFNPYADPNYPDLEFVNYDDPEYQVDQGDEIFNASEDSTEVEIEAMREDRRRRNDEYQFETYHAEFLKSGDLYKGEWTVYRTSTFMEGVDDEEGAFPKFKKEDNVRRVVSSGKKIFLDAPEEGFEFRVDAERLVHEERLAEKHDFEDDEEWEAALAATEAAEASEDVVGKSYTPAEMSAFDFRGSAGAMCVGNCYTVSDITTQGDNDGPLSEMRSEIGLQYKRMRYRVKWDYRVKELQKDEKYPALHLHSMIVCRETRERWPRYKDMNSDDSISERLFGAPGAQGGLFDRPPVGGEDQAKQYMTLDLEGGATVLFPHKIDQDPEAHNGNGWVQTIDWCPGRLRYQVDKKIKSGKEVRGLKTLELTEIQASDAEQWKPNDGGSDMRQ